MAGRFLVALDTLALRAAACALSVTCGDTSPKGRGKSTAESVLIMLKALVTGFKSWLPLGGAGAQRLRGYKRRSEKSVKAIAPTGAALAFLCFDFFFRIVKGEQPLTRCGVGGVQR